MILVLLLLTSVLALKVRVENAKMVLKLAPGEKITKSIGIVNDNDVSANVSLAVSGDLENNLKLEKENFTLAPQERIQAYFTLTAPKKEGTNETNVLVKFSSGEGSPVGFAASVVLITSKSGNSTQSEDSAPVEQQNNSVYNSNPIAGNIANNISSIKFSPIYILLISTLVLIVILVILIIFAARRRPYNQIKLKKSVRMNA